ncbi:helix-turn-helix transcriptional regulator [Vibrio algivorus]|uniref:AlpA family phage regulatory protein n=1 Tax=Vibrio algivorus TaxID=1667024 RepID=A0A557PFI4_9VIBR|nr:AlpA family phage regulatory protein [Vibrio algivorus]TVO39430.1 AlpA family phage regulatory protein [Vibrio algivorus]
MNSNNSSILPLKLIRMKELSKLVGYNKSHIHLLIGEGKFPEQLKIGKRASVWLLPEIMAWINQNWKEGDSFSPQLLDLPRLMRRSDVLNIIGVKKDTLYRMIERDEFPKGRVLGFRETRWDYNDVMGWLASKIQERDALIP